MLMRTIRLTDPLTLTPKQAEAKAKRLIISGYAFPCLYYYNALLERLDPAALARLETVWHKDNLQ